MEQLLYKIPSFPFIGYNYPVNFDTSFMEDDFIWLREPWYDDPTGSGHIGEIQEKALLIFMSIGRTGSWNARIASNLDEFLLLVSAEEPFQVTFRCVDGGLNLEETRWFYLSPSTGELKMDDY